MILTDDDVQELIMPCHVYSLAVCNAATLTPPQTIYLELVPLLLTASFPPSVCVCVCVHG